MRHNNILTIFRKECARFFGDKTLLFTAVIMPGLLIFLIYSLMGKGIKSDLDSRLEQSQQPVAVMVENMPEEVASAFDSLDIQVGRFDTASVFAQIRDKEQNLVYVVFPAEETGETPNIRIFYNSANPASNATFENISYRITAWEEEQCNIFDINADADECCDLVVDEDKDDELADVLSKLIPMLILMMLFSACMAVAPTAIAGEKERGTIATLLVTPLKRKELAFGKILALSLFTLMSGCSSFLGIMLSLPKMMHMDSAEMDVNMSIYSAGDIISILVVILGTVLMMISCVSILSAYAKDVKSSGTLITPFMLVIMGIGLTPLLGSGVPEAWYAYLIPFYNSVQCMSAIFARSASWIPVVVTVVSDLIYTFLAVWVLEKMFSSEKIMFSK